MHHCILLGALCWRRDHSFIIGMCPRGVMVKAMDYGIVAYKFELHSYYYVQLRTNTLGRGMNYLILPAMG